MRNKTCKRLSSIATALTLTVLSITATANDIIQVKLNALSSNVMEFVHFTDVSPVTINGSTLVPLRALCESAGLTVVWDQGSQTAYMRLNALKDSALPIEKHAYHIMTKVAHFGLQLTPDYIEASLKLDNNTIDVQYHYTDVEGDTVVMGRTLDMQSAATLINGGSLVVPLRGTMEAFSLEVDWDQEYNTAKVSIPNNAQPLNGLMIVADRKETVELPVEENTPDPAPSTTVPQQNYEETQTVVQNIPQGSGTFMIGGSGGSQEKGVYIGKFKITHYCSCALCNGSYGNNTAWAGQLRPDITVAVDPSVIPKLSWIYIDGYGVRRAEDCGGAIKGNHIDVCVSNHALAMQMGVKYCDVWYAADQNQ